MGQPIASKGISFVKTTLLSSNKSDRKRYTNAKMNDSQTSLGKTKQIALTNKLIAAGKKYHQKKSSISSANIAPKTVTNLKATTQTVSFSKPFE